MIKTRFAPSPTGYLHIGGIRTALFNYAFAKKNHGQFYLRIEDTDTERSTQAAVDKILQGMHWLGLNHDGEIIYQSKKKDRHKAVIQDLLKNGFAYECYCSKEELEQMRQDYEQKGLKPKYDGRWRPEIGKTLPTKPSNVQPVIRFKNPVSGLVEWDDLVKGRISVNNEELDDLILQRSDGTPTYNLSVVVDDMDMGITHVIRGDDHINNTPRQINIYKACGFAVPEFAHLSMILGEDGQKLSKRHGAASVTDYIDLGYLPESINNYLARLGWSHGDAELFSLEDMCQWFSFDKVTSSASQFDLKKLNWINNHYIKSKSYEYIKAILAPGFVANNFEESKLKMVFELYKERCQTLREFEQHADTVLGQSRQVQEDLKNKYINQDTLQHLKSLSTEFNDSDFSIEAIESILKNYVKNADLKFPQIAMPLRVVLLGTDQSPSVGHIISIIGKELFNKRMDRFL